MKLLLYSGKQYSMSMTAGPSPCCRMLSTWLLVSPTVEMPSIWCSRSPDARKSDAGPYALMAVTIGG